MLSVRGLPVFYPDILWWHSASTTGHDTAGVDVVYRLNVLMLRWPAGIGSSNPTASTAKFINIQNRAGLTALHVACTARARQEEAAQVVKALVQGRADLSLVTKDGENVIHVRAIAP